MTPRARYWTAEEDEPQTGGLLIVSIEATLKAPVGRVLS